MLIVCLTVFSLHFRRWVTWNSMFIVYLTIFSSILSPFQLVSYLKVHVYCVFDYFFLQLRLHFSRWVMWKCMFIVVFDYFLFNLVSTSGGELCESAIVCLTIFFQSCLHFRMVSYVKVHVYCVFDYFLFNPPLQRGELRESACLLCVWLFSLQSCLHFSWWVTWKCMFIVCLTIFSSILSPLQIGELRVNVYFVFDYLIHFSELLCVVTIFSSILSPSVFT